ncbi:unnamed protein product [Musa acuminata subsp. malaccensis]|uniref:(wild Malaysian banana) hypothetical protein n=1 Tax=Musa acuminata subsp. malaccensis TaxID=214687 RepID=A0A804JJA7_MUSAM|nr:unnamed protein product [Musa acuminata subsp. malaccensis]
MAIGSMLLSRMARSRSLTYAISSALPQVRGGRSSPLVSINSISFPLS